MNEYRRTVWRYYAYHATTSYGFWVPVGILFLAAARGYGFGLIGLAQSAFLLASVAADVPAGYLADRAGRRVTLAVGNGLTAVVMALYAVAGSGRAYVALFALWGVAWACHSAIGDAWLYELLDERFEESTFARVKGRAETVELVVSAGAAVLAGLLYAVAPWLPFVANAALAAAGLPLLVSLPAADRPAGAAVSVRETLSVLRAQAGRPEVRWLVAYAALFNALFSLTRWLEQPSLDAVGVPVAGLGLLYAGFKLISAGAMTTTGWIDDRLGPRRFFGLLIPVCGVAYLSIAVLPLAVLPVIVLRRVVDRVSGPIRNQYLNDRIDGVGRATVLSGASMTLSLASGLSNAVVGQVVEATGPLAFLPWAGGGVAVAAGLLWLLTDPVRESPPAAGDGADGRATPGD
jgi:MFS family permease